ncbi:UvrD-helicase domain-containing protein [Rhizobium leguminosarum]|uniref:UvrD-helicase domain-containing protein n=1 Tax=Rhizobium leguminosarum TaxID=384 RepID=UPI001441421B|nr:ATP-dependent helicase [Rhizobium leguminosarum]NKL58324.1 AAA family ATPase [Rhizobium leguminosarum bv. viciae]
MDQEGLKLEPEVVKVLGHVAAGNNFLLSGGAGSGKTYSLVQVISEILRKNRSAAVACITYTNAAVHEIESRIASERLWVSTIHDFLWSAIGSFQRELRSILFDLLSADAPKIKPGSTKIVPEMFDGKEINYKEYRLLGEGVISHDEVIVLAAAMFERYPKLRNILRDRFPYILVDEYQDTAPDVVKVLLDFLPLSSRQGVTGFFGDAMQSIYEKTVGSISDYVVAGRVAEVKKEQNRRNPRLVFELANRLRTDGIVQRASEDANAPNMSGGTVKDGTVSFFYSNGDDDKLDQLRQRLRWDFSDVAETKELNLTHNLIAPQAGFAKLMEIYDGDRVIAYRERIKEFIRDHSSYEQFDGLTFGEVVEAIKRLGTPEATLAARPTPTMKDFFAAHPELIAEANMQPFQAFRRMRVDKDELVDDKKQTEAELSGKGSQRCKFIKHVFKIQKIVHLYEQRRYNEFLRETEVSITNAGQKLTLRRHVEYVGKLADRPVGEVIDFAHENRLVVKDDTFHEFQERKSYLYQRLMKVDYSEFRNIYEYIEGRTGYSTQHKIKGREFNNVLVVLDAGGWTLYNFNSLFEGTGKDTVRQRTEKLFYVCCTRSKNSLVVYFRNPSVTSIAKAKEWFGVDNVVQL